MTDNRSIATDDDDYDDGEEFVLPEEAFQHLPEETRIPLEAMVQQGRAVLGSVDKEIDQLGRISRSMMDLVLLRHVQDKLAAFNLRPNMVGFLDHEMLMTAFVVTYARLQHGGAGYGFARNDLPEHLRDIHDRTIELRNKRFAHTDDHHTITGMMEIQHLDNRFEMHPSVNVRLQVGGPPEWKEMVDVLEGIFSARSDKLVNRLKKKTEYEWTFAPKPEWVEG